MRTAATIQVDGHAVRITSPDRVLYPRVGFTKGDMLDYYARVSPALLPHVAGRPVTLRRFPEGVDGPTWFQTRCGERRPGYVRTVVLTVPSGTPQDYCVLDDLAGLLWAANLSAIELHPLLMLAERPEMPTAVVFDLDPGEGAGLVECARVALELGRALESLGLQTLVKTSGSLGLHVLVPLGPSSSFADTKRFARVVASELAAARPDLVVDRQDRRSRVGRVLVDWLQNDWRRSTVAAYSLRAGPVPTVSMPVDWAEIEAAAGTGDERPLWFTPDAAARRIDRAGDPSASAWGVRQRLPDV